MKAKQPWLLTVGALALHVADEALTGFLDFYNPFVRSMRERLGFWPMPTFTFGVWLTGLIALVIVLCALTPAVRRGAPGTRVASWVLAVVVLANGIAHLAGSVYFGRWLPGATTAPLLIVSSVLLMIRAAAPRTDEPGEPSEPSEPRTLRT
jgi:hypothetical protein